MIESSGYPPCSSSYGYSNIFFFNFGLIKHNIFRRNRPWIIILAQHSRNHAILKDFNRHRAGAERAGSRVFEHLPSNTPASNSAQLGHVATHRKRHSEERKQSWLNYFSHFLDQAQEGQVTEAIIGKILPFSTCFHKSASNPETRIATALRKSAFGSSFNALSLVHLQIWPKINGLAFKEQNSKNSHFYEKVCFR